MTETSTKRDRRCSICGLDQKRYQALVGPVTCDKDVTGLVLVNGGNTCWVCLRCGLVVAQGVNRAGAEGALDWAKAHAVAGVQP